LLIFEQMSGGGNAGFVGLVQFGEAYMDLDRTGECLEGMVEIVGGRSVERGSYLSWCWDLRPPGVWAMVQ
jgi:hypothetical protein